MVTFNKCNIFNFTNKTTSSEESDDISKVLLHGISENMSWLVYTGECGTINTTDPKIMGYYFVKSLYNTLTLNEYTNAYSQLIKSFELSVRSEYLISMKANTNWYSLQGKHQQIIIVYTGTIVHPWLDV